MFRTVWCDSNNSELTRTISIYSFVLVVGMQLDKLRSVGEVPSWSQSSLKQRWRPWASMEGTRLQDTIDEPLHDEIARLETQLEQTQLRLEALRAGSQPVLRPCA